MFLVWADEEVQYWKEQAKRLPDVGEEVVSRA